MKKHPLSLAISLTLLSLTAHAQQAQSNTIGSDYVPPSDSNPSSGANLNTDEQAPITQLDTINVIADTHTRPSALAFGNTQKASDVVVNREQLNKRSATLGNALSEELGIHSNPFGGGSSAPVIRGQDGVRVKILQNGTDVIDVSNISPDHVIATDTLLAERIELVRGPSTLRYGTASSAGVVNVVDKRIPDKMPSGNLSDKVEGEALLRYNTNSNEKLATAGATFALSDHIAMRVEGLSRDANNYEVPEFNSDKKLDYLPDSYNRSKVGTVGLSWIGDQGYLGASYSRREDVYGIPGHNHNYDSCYGHFINWLGSTETGFHGRYYLNAYPHLMDDDDIIDFPHFDGCHVGGHADDHGHEHNTDNPFGFEHNHNHKGPWVDMTSDRYDVRGELRDPIKGIDKVKLSLTHADYYHDEKDPGNPERTTGISEGFDPTLDRGYASAIFKNKGFNSRLEAYHTPINGLQGMLGLQYQKQDMSAEVPYLPSWGDTSKADPRYLLVPHTNKNLSVFGLEQYQIGNFTFEGAARWERQKTPVKYDKELLQRKLEWLENGFPALDSTKAEHPDLSPYEENAVSYAGGVLWDLNSNYRLSFTASHNERIPSPMELYYNGKHLATNSFEYGNKNLEKERSNNFELGLSYLGDNWDYNISGYYNDFDNYIYNENITKFGDLYMRRYNQTTADFYGLEGDLTYRISPSQEVTFFGDFVRGKIGALDPIIGKNIFSDTPEIYGLADSCQGLSGQEIKESGRISECILMSEVENPPEINFYEWCDADLMSDPEEMPWCVDFIYKKLGTDILKRPATNAPRVPPARLGFRYNNHLTDKWSVNMDYSHVFEQNKVSTSTIAIKPLEYDEDGNKLQYENNSLLMKPRFVTENKTEGYNLLNLGADYESNYRNIDYTLSIRANNVLDEKVYIHNSFLPYVPQMGRNFTLGLNVKF